MIIPAFFAGDLVVFVLPSGRRPFFLDGRVTPDMGLGGNCYVARCACGECTSIAVLDMTKACAKITPDIHCQVWRQGLQIWPPFDVTAPIHQEKAN